MPTCVRSNAGRTGADDAEYALIPAEVSAAHMQAGDARTNQVEQRQAQRAVDVFRLRIAEARFMRIGHAENFAQGMTMRGHQAGQGGQTRSVDLDGGGRRQATADIDDDAVTHMEVGAGGIAEMRVDGDGADGANDELGLAGMRGGRARPARPALIGRAALQRAREIENRFGDAFGEEAAGRSAAQAEHRSPTPL